jgi:hypothetical protein
MAENMMPIAQAMRYADLWAAGKMIGGDADAVCLSLHAEVLRLRAALRCMENWDCKGDALQDAYELYHGDGAWEELVSGHRPSCWNAWPG